MSEEQIKRTVRTLILNNCLIDLDNRGQVQYSLNEEQFEYLVEGLVEFIKATKI